MNHDPSPQSIRMRVIHALPRLLGQLDRDADSPTFGCFDRDYWHYKIRDFASAILQQGMVVIECLRRPEAPDNPLRGHPLAIRWVDGALRFWAAQQLGDGSFNEYYPGEHGFPPTAFSLRAALLVLRSRGLTDPDVRIVAAIQKAARWLIRHTETEALNQEAAALAALALARRLPGIRLDADRLMARLDRFLARQSAEGWFPEYGGADTGYLSVTLDCLWDLFEATGELRFRDALDRGAAYIATLIAVSGETPPAVNSRNTDYILPYGLVRAAAHNPLAAAVVRALFQRADTAAHPLARTDDRYLCHYVYASCARSLAHLDAVPAAAALLPCQTGGDYVLPEAGVLIRHVPGRASVYVAARKGGVVCRYGPDGIRDADHGWRLPRPGGRVAVTHWQDPGYRIQLAAGADGAAAVSVEGAMTVHRWRVSSPLRHTVLRLAAFVLGRRLIPRLKQALIFKRVSAGIRFRRDVRLDGDAADIRDTVTAPRRETANMARATDHSLRHVASAGGFIPDDLIPPAPAAEQPESAAGDTRVFIRRMNVPLS
ncbi:MAG TPA: hypothetical protein PLN26_02350 [Acidobacteriota bacterium]|nr:hypothetical protein [Acidobacteriota bacterium]HQF86044.1 hypothetical protein [Acidobacteriota bacterium]HQG90713.1 hypothetical protein [Acidobacteriota bacterium]HQK86020.1 hypothetical protein [Acidobacteriota bacterium]